MARRAADGKASLRLSCVRCRPRSLSAKMTRTELFSLVAIVATTLCSHGGAEQDYESSKSKVYHNQFAVHIPDGAKAADEIASKYGFTNLGQVSTFLTAVSPERA